MTASPWRKALDWVVTIALSIAFVLVFEAKVAKPYRIPSSSMEPLLNCSRPGPECLGSTDDRVLAFRLEYDFESPQRGQVVVFRAPKAAASACEAGDGGTTFVKRLIGLPGERVHENGKGFISILKPGSRMWLRLKEPYVTAQDRLADTQHFDTTWKVARGEYFMLGDNRAFSCDSRSWGAVPRASLIGPVVFRYWPLARIGFP
ncbi:MAG TPA: signal peptidase I [Gaiellaceae bacterium]|nr:signal peptidase I [Gaiellaceae bacterium]